MKLYELTSELSSAFKFLDEMVECGDIDEEILNDTLSALEMEFEDKATSIITYAQELQMFADQIKERSDKMLLRRKQFERKADYFKSYVLENMLKLKYKKIESPEFAISIRNNPESVVVDEAKLEDRFFRTKTIKEADKVKIKMLLKSGIDVPGATLSRSVSLSVR